MGRIRMNRQAIILGILCFIAGIALVSYLLVYGSEEIGVQERIPCYDAKDNQIIGLECWGPKEPLKQEWVRTINGLVFFAAALSFMLGTIFFFLAFQKGEER